MAEQRCVVEGMTCNGCAVALQRALEPVVGKTTVDFQTGIVRLHDWPNDPPAALEQKLKQAVDDAGFSFVQGPS